MECHFVHELLFYLHVLHICTVIPVSILLWRGWVIRFIISRYLSLLEMLV
jgi:hypothetical protein